MIEVHKELTERSKDGLMGELTRMMVIANARELLEPPEAPVDAPP